MISFNNKIQGNILNLQNCDIQPDDMLEVIKFIEDNPNITELDLICNNLGVEGTRIIVSTPILASLIRLNLWNNKLGSDGAKAIAESKTLTNLITLELGCNDIKAEGAKAIAGSKTLINLTNLGLIYNDLGPEGVQAIAESKTLVNLTNLYLGINNIENIKYTPKRWGEHPRITDHLVGGAEAIASSSALTNLTTLDLRCNQIRAWGAKALASSVALINLTNLDLRENSLRAEGVEAIASSLVLTNLTSLNLWNNYIGPEGTQAIASASTLANLTTLDLGFNFIMNKGAKAIASSSTLTNLTYLGLRCNLIGIEGMKAIVLTSTFTSLTTVDLSDNNVKTEGLIELAKTSALSNKNIIYSTDNFYDIFTKALQEGKGTINRELAKKIIFQVAPKDYSGKYIKYLLKHPEDYPFPINSRDENGRTLFHIYKYNHFEMNRFLLMEFLESPKWNIKLQELVEFIIINFSISKKYNSEEEEDINPLKEGVITKLKYYQSVDKELLLAALISPKNHDTLQVEIKDKTEASKYCVKIDRYIQKNYFTLTGICKTCQINENKYNPYVSLPAELLYKIVEFLWIEDIKPCSTIGDNALHAFVT